MELPSATKSLRESWLDESSSDSVGCLGNARTDVLGYTKKEKTCVKRKRRGKGRGLYTVSENTRNLINGALW